MNRATRLVAIRDRSKLGAVAAAVVGGIGIGLALPPIGIWPFAPVGLALVFGALKDRRWQTRLWCGLFAGVGQFAIGLSWVVAFSLPGYLALVVFEAIFLGIACSLCRNGPTQPVAFIGWFTIAEAVRDRWPFGGLPIAGIAIAMADSPFLGLVRLLGPLLLIASTAAIAVCLVAIARLVAHRANRASLTHLVGPLVGLCLVGAAVGVAAVVPNGGPPRSSVEVDLVQGGGIRGLREIDVPSATVLASVLTPTEELAGHPAIVVWPEDSLAISGPLAGSGYDQLLGAVARRLHTTLLVGATETVGTARFRNEIVAYGPSGKIVATFEKVHPVPFGEYVPFRSFVGHFADLSDVPRDAIVGNSSGMITTPAGRLALLVSYETFFSDRGRSGVRAGGELLVVPTNTASYASAAVPSQELAASRLQAVGEGRSLIQAASTGYSAVIDPEGRVFDTSALGVPTVIHATVALRDGATPYSNVGDLPMLIAALGTAIAATFLARRLTKRSAR